MAVAGPDDPDKSDVLPLERRCPRRPKKRGWMLLGMRTDIDRLYSAMDSSSSPLIGRLPDGDGGGRNGPARHRHRHSRLSPGSRRRAQRLLVPVLDPVRLGEAIKKVGDDPTSREKMSEASARIARERFDENEVVRIVMDAYRDGLKAKGIGHLMPAGMIDPPPRLEIRKGVARDARALAQRHATEIATGFLPMLGPGFMKVLYQALIDWKGSSFSSLMTAAGQSGSLPEWRTLASSTPTSTSDTGGGPVWLRCPGSSGRATCGGPGRPSATGRTRSTSRPSCCPWSWRPEPGKGLSVMLGARLLEELTERGAQRGKGDGRIRERHRDRRLPEDGIQRHRADPGTCR